MSEGAANHEHRENESGGGGANVNEMRTDFRRAILSRMDDMGNGVHALRTDMKSLESEMHRIELALASAGSRDDLKALVVELKSTNNLLEKRIYELEMFKAKAITIFVCCQGLLGFSMVVLELLLRK